MTKDEWLQAKSLLQEFVRQSGDLRPDFYRRCQRVFRKTVLPVMEAAEPPRPRGRPRKTASRPEAAA